MSGAPQRQQFAPGPAAFIVCSNKGIRIITIKDNFNLSDDINSKIIAFAFALASEIERNLISQRTK